MKHLPFPQLPSSFYDETQFLRHIRQSAHALRVAPDAVLGATLARIATATPPTTYIDTPEPTTLNLIVGLIAPSGDGKSRAQTTARRLLPDLGLGVNDSLPLGTGEGFVDSYFVNVSVVNESGKGKHTEKRQGFTSALFWCDEGETLFNLGSRKGSTILQTLRTAWSAGVLGSTNASQETRRKLDAHTYRACVLVAFQPSCGSLLVADSNGGTPQRFLYVSAQDLEMPQVPPSYPGQLEYVADCEPFGLQVHTEILRELDTNKYRRARNEIIIDPLDTHNDYMRLRIAGLLTLANRRRFIDLEPWIQAGLIVDNSRQVRRTLDDWAKLNHFDNLDKQLKDKDYTEGVTEKNRYKRDLNRIVSVLVTMVENNPGIYSAQALSRLGRDRHKINDDELLTALYATNKVKLVGKQLQIRQ